MEIAKNKTELTKKDIFKMQNISLLKSSWIVLLFAAVLILMGFRIRNGAFVMESLFFVIVGAIVLPLYFLIVELIMLKQNKKLPPITVFEYTFTASEIIATASDTVHTESINIKYSQISKYKIEKDYITVLVDKNTSLLISQKGFQSEEEKEKAQKLLTLNVVKKSKRK